MPSQLLPQCQPGTLAKGGDQVAAWHAFLMAGMEPKGSRRGTGGWAWGEKGLWSTPGNVVSSQGGFQPHPCELGEAFCPPFQLLLLSHPHGSGCSLYLL